MDQDKAEKRNDELNANHPARAGFTEKSTKSTKTKVDDGNSQTQTVKTTEQKSTKDTK